MVGIFHSIALSIAGLTELHYCWFLQYRLAQTPVEGDLAATCGRGSCDLVWKGILQPRVGGDLVDSYGRGSCGQVWRDLWTRVGWTLIFGKGKCVEEASAGLRNDA